ncbi:hypothetical protein LTR84_002917 [Exophiala bonariae]|uniref:Zn(2)-C6 fungal-type domain-containing protein n=1 Tax=Exophiala bonariae TaxID=1690606 RepID=A0AAV9NDR0_9EURO|nr:hypothetical protein LTR84_002917 [Exophiala bonariae]
MNIHVERHTSRLERAPRTSRACSLCHARKVKCDISPSKSQCSNCQRDGIVCEQRPRQRKTHPPKAKVPPWKSPVSSPNVAIEHAQNQILASMTNLRTMHQVAASQNESEMHHEIEVSQQPQRPLVTGTQGETNQHQNHSPSGKSISSTCSSYECGYMQRSTYIAPDDLRAEDGSEINYPAPPQSETTHKIAILQNAFKLPPRAVRESLFENFWTHCYVWDPIIDRSQIIGKDLENLSPLLLQTIFLAGSRIASPSQPRLFATSEDYYTRAKTLFWLDYEKDPMNLLIASSLMHWWNPHGPERVSTNTSSFWCRITVSLAQQMGLHRSAKVVPNESLRRRIWWSIVARDCLISVAHGRPQAISIEESDIPRPTLEDFPEVPSVGAFFVAYVELSLIMGRFTRHEIQKSSSKDLNTAIEDALYRWTRNLPEHLQLSNRSTNGSNSSLCQSVKSYTLESRQLNVLYFTTIILIYRSKSLDGPFPTAAVMAASTVAGIIEDFVARDEVRTLGPCFSFHILTASIALLSCYPYPQLWVLAQEDLKALAQGQEELQKRWPTVLGSIASFERMLKYCIATQKKVTGTPQSSLTPYQAVFFDTIDVTLCRLYRPLTLKLDDASLSPTYFDMNSQALVQTLRGENQLPSMASIYSHGDLIDRATFLGHEQPVDLLGTDQMFPEDTLISNGAMGDWLFWELPNLTGA